MRNRTSCIRELHSLGAVGGKGHGEEEAEEQQGGVMAMARQVWKMEAAGVHEMVCVCACVSARWINSAASYPSPFSFRR